MKLIVVNWFASTDDSTGFFKIYFICRMFRAFQQAQSTLNLSACSYIPFSVNYNNLIQDRPFRGKIGNST